MSDQKISELTKITGVNLADADEFVVVDVSADQTKAVTRAEFFKNTPSITTSGNLVATGNVSGADGTFTNSTASEAGLTVSGNANTGWGLQIGAHNANSASDLVLSGNAVVGHETSVSYTIPTGGYYRWMTGATSNTGGTAGSSEKIRLTDSGNFGIGVTNPTEKLHVAGNGKFTGDVTIGDDLFLTGPNPKITMTDTDVADEYGEVYHTSGNNFYTARNGAANGQHIFYQNAGGTTTEAMRIDENGRLGLGVLNPTEKLDVEGSIKASGTIKSAGNIVTGNGSGSVALTVNDGYGNANVTFNHEDGVPDFLGNGARIVVNTDVTTSPTMIFQLGSAVTSGVPYSTTEYLRVNTLGISVNGTVTANGGIYLGGSAAANLLDDYEEGTWTPILNTTTNGNLSTSSSNARYVKVGNLVTLTASIVMGSTSSTSRLDLLGNPFSAGYTQAQGTAISTDSSAPAFLYGMGTRIQLKEQGNGTNYEANKASGKTVFINVTYVIA